MYPTIPDLIQDITGINLFFLRWINTFGFFVALSFLGSAWFLSLELKRKELEGLFHAIDKKNLIGKPATIQELIINALFGFVLGFKLIAAFLEYRIFIDDPQSFLLSWKGNWIGGILSGAFMAYWKYHEKEKEKSTTPKWETVKVHPHQMVGDMTIIAAIAGLLGAKIFHNLENIDEFIADPIGSLLSFSGLTFYGGLICGGIAVLYYAKKNQINLLYLLDAIAPALLFAYGFGRIGCQLAGDGDWGIVNTLSKPGSLSFLPDWMWAFHYPHNVINEGIPIPNCIGRHCFMLEDGVFPTPFYETVISLLMCTSLWLYRKKIKTSGMLFSLYLILNGTERFFIEKIRVNTVYHLLGKNITQAEIISVCLILLGIIMMIMVNKKPSGK